MAASNSASPTAETLVLDVLRSSSPLTIDEVVSRLPQLRWNEVFHTIDLLSRQGRIVLRRQGFNYEVCDPTTMSARCCA